MTESIPPAQTPPIDPTVPAPAPRKKRRWLRVLVGLLVLGVVGLVLLVVLLPTLAGLSPVRNIVVGQVQKFVPHGKVELADYSLGWFSPIRLTGFKLLDEQNNVVLQADEIKTDLTLLKAVRQQFDLGETVVDATGHLVVDQQTGSTNLQHVLGFDEKTPTTKPHAEHKEKASEPTRLPNVRGNVTLKLAGDATLTDKGQSVAVVRLRPGSGGTIRIPDINSPVDADLKLLYDTGDNTKTATVGLQATVDAVQNNQLDLNQLAAKLNLPVSDVDLAGLRPVLALGGLGKLRLAGIASGQVAGELKPGQAGGIKGAFAVENLVADATALSPQVKDVYKAARLDLPVDVSRVVTNGVTRLTVNTGVTVPEAKITVSGDVPEAALAKLANKQMAGDTGALGVSVAADLKRLAAALPHTLRLPADLVVQGGTLGTDVTLTIRPADVQAHVKTDVTAQGTRGGKPVAVQPITFTSDATLVDLAALADGGTEWPKGLADLLVSFNSAFATMQAGGKTLATLSGSGKADLAAARQQAVQFTTALDAIDMAGNADFDLSSKRDAADPTGLLADLKANVAKLHLTLPGKPPLDLATARVALTANVKTDAGGFSPELIRTATATLAAGNGGDTPLVDAQTLVTDVNLTAKTAAAVNVAKFVVPSLPQLQRLIDPFVPALKAQGIELTNGAVDFKADLADVNWGQLAANVKSLNASLPNLSVRKNGADLFNDTVMFTTAATLKTSGDTKTIDVTALSLNSALATLTKADGPLHVELVNDLPRGTGAVSLDADAVRLNKIVRLTAGDATKGVPQVTGGRITGTLALASPSGGDATVKLDGKLAGLTLADTPVKNETYTLAADAQVPAALDGVRANLNLAGDYFKVVASNINASKPAEGTPAFKMVKSARLDVSVDDLARFQTVAKAFVPAAATMDLAGGMTLNAEVSGPGVAKVNFTGNRLAVRNAQGQSFAFDRQRPVTLLLIASVTGDKGVDGVTVTDLNGDFGVVAVKAASQIEVKNLATTPTANGKLNLTGTIERIAPLLQVVQGSPTKLPYEGKFDLTETVAPKDKQLALTGGGTIADFAMLDDAGKPTFVEKQVKLTNDVAVDTAAKSAAITNVVLEMASSGAATVKVNGGVDDWAEARKLKNVVVGVDADGAKAWPLVYAFLPENQKAQFKDAKVSGPVKIDLSANGAYPAKPTWNESVRSVVAYGNVSVKSISTMGMDISDFVLPISVRDNGTLVTGDLRKKKGERFAKPFTVNGGKGDFGSISLMLGDPDLKLTIGRNSKLLQDVQINPVLASQVGSLASVLFNDASDASGQLDLTVTECNNVLLKDLFDKKAQATFVYSITNLKLDGSVPGALAKALKWGDQGINGNIDGATLTLKNGIAHQDMLLQLQHANPDADDTAAVSKRRNRAVDDGDGKTDPKDVPKTKTETMKFAGGVNLADNTFKDYQLTLSSGLLFKDLRKKMPDGATVDLRGKVTNFSSIVAQAVAQLAIEGYGKDALDKALNGKDGDKLGGLLDKLGGKKKGK